MSVILGNASAARPAPERAWLEARAEWLRVHFGPGEPAHADFHWFWLRHLCDGDRHPQTGERLLDASEVPLSIRPRRVALDEARGSVLIDWDEPSGRQSRYDLGWLRAHAYAPDRIEVPPPPSDLGRITLGARDFADPEALTAACLGRLAAHGAVLVRGFSGRRPPEGETETLIEAFQSAGLTVIATHFGRIEDLRTDNTTNANTDQLGYTDAPVDLHTDQPFIDKPPRYQMLQCVRPAQMGGDSALCDAEAAARYLASIDEEAYRLLTTVPVRFHRKQKEFESVWEGPLLDLRGPSGFQVRYSYFTYAPFQRPFAEMEAWYRAYGRFARLVRDSAHQYRARLEAGDFVLYDNYRMLHARTGFSGARWMRGIYFDPASSVAVR